MPCPVCRGPHIRWLLDKLQDEDQIVVCSFEDCDKEIRTGWLVYAQLTSSVPPDLDESISLCCDDHVEQEKATVMKDGSPTVCLPFCVQDAQECA
jgi:hypothetical protein